MSFWKKAKATYELRNNPYFKVFGTFKDYYIMLKTLQYLHKLLWDFRSKRLAMRNKDRNFFQYNSGGLVCLISPLTSQVHTMSRKVAIKYVGSLVIYKINDPNNYLLMMLEGQISRGLFKHERLKPAIMRTSQGNICNLAQLKQIINIRKKL